MIASDPFAFVILSVSEEALLLAQGKLWERNNLKLYGIATVAFGDLAIRLCHNAFCYSERSEAE